MLVQRGLKDDYKRMMNDNGYKYNMPTIRKNNIAGSIVGICGLGCLVILAIVLMCGVASADSVNIDRLATAIYNAEGGSNTRHPYGILAKYKHTTPRQACINTIKSGLKRYSTYKGKDDFIVFLSKTYCPIEASNDPTGLNKNWVKNVKYFYNKAV